MARQRDIPEEDWESTQTAPGVRMLKDLWNIPSSRPKDSVQSGATSSDIYSVPDRRNSIPRRRQGRAVR